jgi:hypothetical protein
MEGGEASCGSGRVALLLLLRLEGGGASHGGGRSALLLLLGLKGKAGQAAAAGEAVGLPLCYSSSGAKTAKHVAALVDAGGSAGVAAVAAVVAGAGAVAARGSARIVSLPSRMAKSMSPAAGTRRQSPRSPRTRLHPSSASLARASVSSERRWRRG